jgi:hypothetical protein
MAVSDSDGAVLRRRRREGDIRQGRRGRRRCLCARCPSPLHGSYGAEYDAPISVHAGVPRAADAWRYWIRSRSAGSLASQKISDDLQHHEDYDSGHSTECRAQDGTGEGRRRRGRNIAARRALSSDDGAIKAEGRHAGGTRACEAVARRCRGLTGVERLLPAPKSLTPPRHGRCREPCACRRRKSARS